MSQPGVVVRRAEIKIVERGDFDDEPTHYDWEILGGGKRYLHKKGSSLKRGWIIKETYETTRIEDRELSSRLRKAAKAVISDFPDGRLVRLPSGVVKLYYMGYAWKRCGIDLSGKPCAGKQWFLRVIGDGTKEYHPVRKKNWEVLDQKVAELEKANPDDAVEFANVPPPSPDTQGQQETVRHKRTKYGIRIYSSDHKHYFDFGCWKSTKYPGKSSIRLGVAGKRALYTIAACDWQAMVDELHRGKP